MKIRKLLVIPIGLVGFMFAVIGAIFLSLKERIELWIEKNDRKDDGR